jgi:hypothetical protein
MPWELPRRKRGQGKSSGTGRFAAAAVVVVAAAGIITVGALSIRAAATSGITSETDLAVPALVGTGVPLAILGLGWLRLRRRVTAVVLAFTLGLGTNVIYLASAVPAAAVTDNSSVFTFRNTSSFGTRDMVQNYTPASGTAATCPATLSANWTCGFTSDTFTTGQTMNAGTAQADLYLENQGSVTNDYSNGYTFVSAGSVTSIALTKMANLVSGDVIIAHISLRSGAGTITKPSASWSLVDRIDSSTVTLAVYSLVAGSSEPASYTWSWPTAVKAVGIMRNFSGVDTSAPVDGHAGATESSASTTHVAPSVNAAYANEIRVVGIADASSGTCNTISGWNLTSGFSSGGGGGSAQVNGSMFYATTPAGLGATGTLTATCGNDIAATHQLTLKPSPTPSCTVTATLRKTTPIKLRASTTKTVNSGSSIVVDTPAGTQQNDLMFLTLAWTGSAAPTTPSGWTLTSSNGSGSTTSLYSYRRIAGASEPATYTINFSVAATIAAWEGSYIGVDTTTPFDVSSGFNANGTTHTTPGITTTVFGDLIVVGYALAANGTFTTPTAMTAEGNPIAGTSAFESLAVFDTIAGAAGTIAGKTSTSSVSGQSVFNIWSFKPIASNTVTLGSATPSLGSIASPTLQSVSISTSAATFGTGDRLVLDVSVPNDTANCGVRLSYDEAGTPSKLTVATIVPEGIAGLLLLAPALPFGARWWKRRRP